MRTSEEREVRQQDAYHRATTGQSLINYKTILEEFMARGIEAAAIEPRVNVLTFEAWKAIGRYVRRGEKGVKVITWVPTSEKKNESTGEVERPAGKRPWTATVFHISQTDERGH